MQTEAMKNDGMEKGNRGGIEIKRGSNDCSGFRLNATIWLQVIPSFSRLHHLFLFTWLFYVYFLYVFFKSQICLLLTLTLLGKVFF